MLDDYAELTLMALQDLAETPAFDNARIDGDEDDLIGPLSVITMHAVASLIVRMALTSEEEGGANPTGIVMRMIENIAIPHAENFIKSWENPPSADVLKFPK